MVKYSNLSVNRLHRVAIVIVPGHLFTYYHIL